MIGTTIFLKVLFHFMCMGVLAASMSVHHMGPQKPERTSALLELKFLMV